ncbi:MAG TPA: universal stress protein [Solirubrobacteraceae bacterium]|nr:universal stress protein [Solirubrobacteraceae bacterium]
MFENVLVGVDGRPNGRDAIALAARLTDPHGRLTLVHVHGGELNPMHAITPGLVAEERDACMKLLEREREAAEVSAELLGVVAMSPGGGLHQQAEELGADLLVVGSCSHGAFGRVMLGDDTRAALNGAPCAAAIAVRGYSEHPTPIARIGVGYDGSPESRAALAAARRLAEPTRAAVRALEVVSIPTYAYTGLMPPAIGESIDAMLKAASARMRALGDDVEGHAVYGLTGEELAAFGDEVDLLVVGSRSYGPVRRMMLGSTSDYLERHARCSLLVLPRLAVEATGAGGEDGLQGAAPVSATA